MALDLSFQLQFHGAGADTDGYAHGDTRSDADRYADRYADCDTDRDAVTHSDADRDTDGHTNTDHYAERNPDRHTHPGAAEPTAGLHGGDGVRAHR